ncbi:Uncharacterised protein [Bordetella pertussis]|nr:Uncharacterised protein [Bordetella pertussis]
MHAQVAWAHAVVLADLVASRVIAFHQKGRTAMVQAQPGSGVSTGAQRSVEVAHLVHARVLHGPEAGIVHGKPLLQLGCVRLGVERT